MIWDLYAMDGVSQSITGGCRVIISYGWAKIHGKDWRVSYGWESSNPQDSWQRKRDLRPLAYFQQCNVAMFVQNHWHTWLGCMLSADPPANQDHNVEHRMQVVSEPFWATFMFHYLILLWVGRLHFRNVICNQWIWCAGICFNSLSVRWLVFTMERHYTCVD